MSSASHTKKVKFAQFVYSGSTQREAAARAGYKRGAGLEAVASKLMRDAVVVAELAALRVAGAAQAVADRKELVERLTEHFRADMGDFISVKKGMVVAFDFEQAKKQGKTHLIESFEATEDGRVKVKFHSVHGAADRLARLLGLNAPDKQIVQNVGPAAQTMAEAELMAEAKKLGIA